MKKNLIILVNIMLLLTIMLSLYTKLRQLPIDNLNESSNFLQSQDLFMIESGEMAPCGSFWLRQWHEYFLNIKSYAPQLSEAHSLLGFYHIIKNDPRNAAAAIKQAQALNPSHWANDYNLGVIYYNQGNFQEAISYFQKAAASDLRLNAIFISSSKPINDLIQKAKGRTINIQERLENKNSICMLAIKKCLLILHYGQAPLPQRMQPALF